MDPDEIFDDANKFARQFPDCQFFVATDEERLLKRARRKLHGKVVFYDAIRSKNGRAIHR